MKNFFRKIYNNTMNSEEKATDEAVNEVIDNEMAADEGSNFDQMLKEGGFLNEGFWFIRAIFYFTAWSALARNSSKLGADHRSASR